MSGIIGISREITPEWKQSYSKTILIKFDVSNSNSKNNFRPRQVSFFPTEGNDGWDGTILFPSAALSLFFH